jgi:hypothetical protein
VTLDQSSDVQVVRLRRKIEAHPCQPQFIVTERGVGYSFQRTGRICFIDHAPRLEIAQRGKLERLCRYIARPAVAIERLSRTAQGHVRYALKTPYRDGTTHVSFEALDFLSRLAALVPNPGVNLTRYHGVFAANHRLRAQIVPGQRGRDGSGEGQGSAVAIFYRNNPTKVFRNDLARGDASAT